MEYFFPVLGLYFSIYGAIMLQFAFNRPLELTSIRCGQHHPQSLICIIIEEGNPRLVYSNKEGWAIARFHFDFFPVNATQYNKFLKERTLTTPKVIGVRYNYLFIWYLASQENVFCLNYTRLPLYTRCIILQTRILLQSLIFAWKKLCTIGFLLVSLVSSLSIYIVNSSFKFTTASDWKWSSTQKFFFGCLC